MAENYDNKCRLYFYNQKTKIPNTWVTDLFDLYRDSDLYRKWESFYRWIEMTYSALSIVVMMPVAPHNDYIIFKTEEDKLAFLLSI